MLRYYVLVSKSLTCLIRQFGSIPVDRTVVIINSQHQPFIDVAIDYCIDNLIEYHITESDGTPATGKNSMNKIFLESTDEYMVAIDGDDFITPYGVELYDRVAASGKAPDLICIYRQLGAMRCAPKHFIRGQDFEDLESKYGAVYFADKSNGYIDPEGLKAFFMKWCEVSDEKASQWVEDRLEHYELLFKYGEARESFCRMVFFSRKAVAHMHYDNSMKIGEDTAQWMLMKKLAFEGEIDMRRRNERKYGHTYIYCMDSVGVTEQDHKSKRFDWMKPLTDHLNTLDGLIENQSLPEFLDHEYEINEK